MEAQTQFKFPNRVVRVTSLESYRSIRASLHERERAVMEALQLFLTVRPLPRAPTSYELLNFMKSRERGGEVFDLNTVRPRLTKLKERNMVVNCEKVICTVTNKRAFTWTISGEVDEAMKAEGMVN